jgi:tripartite-type tricarboxylate transporter receptor subunit TctC
MGHVRAGRLRAIASGGEKRSPLTPDIPTVIEAGVPGFVSTGWAGLMAPKRTPKAIVDKLHATMVRALADPQTREQMERAGGDPVSSTPQEMLRIIREDYARMGQAIKLAGLKVE